MFFSRALWGRFFSRRVFSLCEKRGPLGGVQGVAAPGGGPHGRRRRHPRRFSPAPEVPAGKRKPQARQPPRLEAGVTLLQPPPVQSRLLGLSGPLGRPGRPHRPSQFGGRARQEPQNPPRDGWQSRTASCD